MKMRFLNTQFATHTGISGQMPSVLKYSVENRNSILSIAELISLVQPMRTILKTPMSSCFDRIATSGALSNFAAFCILNKNSSIPEILTASSITLDLKEYGSASSVSSIPELKEKVLVNITSLVKPNKVDGGYVVNAIDLFQGIFVRGQLCLSYADSADIWLAPYLAEYTIKSYSMILSGLISRYFNLSLSETLKVAGVFALFFSQLISGDKDNLAMPALFNRCTFVGNRKELEDLAKECEPWSKNGLTLDATCEAIATIINDRMKTFNMGALLALAGNLGPDIITSQIALEYPPYWVYQVVLALSGAKVPLIYQMNSQKLTAEGRSKYLTALMASDYILSRTR